MKHTQSRVAVRLPLLAWSLASALLLSGCAAPGPLGRHADAAPTATSHDVALRTMADGMLASGQPAASQRASIRVQVATETRWPENGWNAIDTRQSYSQLLSRLKQAISESELSLVFEVGPTEAAANRGIDIPGNRVIGVFNNQFAVDVLRLSVPAMIEAPIRFYVTEREDGHATLSWIEPSHIYAPYIDAIDNGEDALELRKISTTLDLLFSRIAASATQDK